MTDGCRIPDEFVKAYRTSWLRNTRYIDESLAKLTRERLTGIPDECFTDGQKAQALAEIERREKEQAARKAKEKYLESLDPALRKKREEVIRWNSGWGACILSENAIIELAKQSIADEEKRHQELVCKIEKLKVSDPEMYAAAERRARMDIGPTYKWDLTPEVERLEALGRAASP